MTARGRLHTLQHAAKSCPWVGISQPAKNSSRGVLPSASLKSTFERSLTVKRGVLSSPAASPEPDFRSLSMRPHTSNNCSELRKSYKQHGYLDKNNSRHTVNFSLFHDTRLTPLRPSLFGKSITRSLQAFN